MNELEIILPVHPSVPSIWELMGLCLIPGLLFILAAICFWLGFSTPISDEEVQRVLRER